MYELMQLCNDIKSDLQGVIKSLAKITKIQSRILGISDEWNRKEEVLKLLAISPRTFNRLISTGKLPYSKVSGITFIKTSDVEKLLNENYHNQN